MTRLRVSAAARRDLRDIGETGRRDFGKSASAAHINGFRRLFRLLRDQPFAGAEWSELNLDIRSLSHRPHRILYRVEGDTVIIVRIIHQSRDMRQVLPGTH
ncbi:type II toxin-antitoxin system RelE/ParE family toxin [Sphingomonas melonis]|uniref:Toxin ParE1/3/4 n=1 Tax=Sphingomonas melonis TaxID=152682 RepID=A0A7Y9FJT6_9SPHN|nr:type II toxin-antitoxin system RelE/ParE family toxin [Sphingomonas melonis]NYD88589.1 toxin ParE1/3/4 [Sphingomonas melonis]